MEGDCTKKDLEMDELGVEITCPIGVKHCMVMAESGHTDIERSCNWRLPSHIDIIEELGDYESGCMGSGNYETCYCPWDKCNTGFHGNALL